MDLTKNEKKTLNLLLENARISDSDIAKKLKISSQAVGKIRRKIENNLIESYTLNLNYSKLGIETLAISLAKLTSEGMDKGELEIEQKLLDEPHIIQVYRLPSGNFTHIILYGFKDISELDNFFHSSKRKIDLHRFIENREIFTFSNHSMIKNNAVQLFHKIIEETGPESIKVNIQELEYFKKKINQD
jgi:DNA-binding Lrp family transcriptional regulator